MEIIPIENKIYEIRGQRVMLDFDLAGLYGIETKRLKEAVRRNIKRFPSDFMFELTREEYNFLRSQFASLENQGKGKYAKYPPFSDYNDLHEDTRMQLELINESLAELQVNRKFTDSPRTPIGYVKPE